MVQVRLKLKENQVPADVTDALGVALCHAGRLKTAKQPPLLWTTDFKRVTLGTVS